MSVYRCAGCGAVNRTTRSVRAAACYRCRRLLDTSGRPQSVDAAALVTTVLSSPAPVLVDFERRETDVPALAAVGMARAGELVVLKVDPGEEPAAAEAYGIRSTPTLVLFSGGAEIARRQGSAQDVSRWVEAAAR
jgi:thioredoxin 2